jgi:hypothetical protein
MRKGLILALCAALAPAAVAGQGIGVAVKAGTIGVGVEGALGLGSNLAVRGGAALVPVNLDKTYSDIEFGLDLPESYVNIGLDYYLGDSPFRLSGGMLFKPDEPMLRGEFIAPQDIGGRSYTPTEIGTLVGEIDSGNRAPFVTLGFGRHTSSGLGLYADVGMAFLEDPKLSIRQEGGTLTGPAKAEFDQRLEQERQDIEDDLGGWQRFYPIVQVGLKMGLGR